LEKLRSLGILLIAVGLLMLTVDHVSAYVDSMTNEKQKLLEVKENINEEYELFLTNVMEYKTAIPSINDFYIQYYETMAENDNKYKEIIQEIDLKAKSVEETSKKLKSYCKNNYNDENLRKTCESFNKNYTNYKTAYIEINDNYNNAIEEYNEWAKETNNKTLEKYAPINYNEYSISI